MKKLRTILLTVLLLFFCSTIVFSQQGNNTLPYKPGIYQFSFVDNYEIYCEVYGQIDLVLTFNVVRRLMPHPSPIWPTKPYAGYSAVLLNGNGTGVDEKGGIWRYKGTLNISWYEDDNVFRVNDNQRLFGPNGEKLSLRMTQFANSEYHWFEIEPLCD